MRLITTFAVLVLCACASGPDTYPLPMDHPAHASAPATPAQPPDTESAVAPAGPSPDALEAFRRLMGESGSAFRREVERGSGEAAPAEQDSQQNGGGHEHHR